MFVLCYIIPVVVNRDILRRRFLKLLNGMNGLPVVLSPSEEELEALRKKLTKVAGAHEMWTERLKSKREKMFATRRQSSAHEDNVSLSSPIVNKNEILYAGGGAGTHVEPVVVADVKTVDVGEAPVGVVEAPVGVVEDLSIGLLDNGQTSVEIPVSVVKDVEGQDRHEHQPNAHEVQVCEKSVEKDGKPVQGMVAHSQALPEPKGIAMEQKADSRPSQTEEESVRLVDEYKKRTMVSTYNIDISNCCLHYFILAGTVAFVVAAGDGTSRCELRRY